MAKAAREKIFELVEGVGFAKADPDTSVGVAFVSTKTMKAIWNLYETNELRSDDGGELVYVYGTVVHEDDQITVTPVRLSGRA